MPAPTQADWDSFPVYRNYHAKVLYLYFVQGLAMPKIAEIVPGIDDSRTVSMICRCFNFDNQTKRQNGKYSPTKAFAMKYGEVTEEDIIAFVKKYPKGIRRSEADFGNGEELESFLVDRLTKRAKKAKSVPAAPAYDDDYANAYDDAYDGDYGESYDDFTEGFGDTASYGNNYDHTSGGSGGFGGGGFRGRSFGGGGGFGGGGNLQSAGEVLLGILGLAILFVILSLVFNWFGLRTLLVGFLINVIMYAWTIGLCIFLILLLINKIPVMDGKHFIVKTLFFLAVGGASVWIVSLLLDVLSRLQ